MRAKLAVLASVVLCGNATAEPAKYAVDGLAVGMRLNSDDASYRQYRCSPSDQFDGLAWCQKTRRDKSGTAIYSLLHSGDGSVLYINRSQDSAFSNPKKAEEEIQQYSRKIGESPRVMKMPHRSGLPDGLIAVWGKIKLEQLDQESTKILAGRRGLKKGLLIDFLGNFARSAKAGLPIYRIDGGRGFVWAASFDQKGRGILRLGAVDASTFLPPLAGQQPTARMNGATSEASEAKPELRQANEKVQPELPDDTATIVDPEKAEPAAERARTEDARVRVNEKVQSELTDATATIIDPEKAKPAAERARTEDARVTERANLDAVAAPLEAKTAIGDENTGWWETLVYGSIVGLLVSLTAFAVVIYMRRQKAGGSKGQSLQRCTHPIKAVAQPVIRRALSPEAALAKIEEVRRSLLLELTSSPSLAPSPTPEKPILPTVAANPRLVEKLVEPV
jgi:hypothetical protein